MQNVNRTVEIALQAMIENLLRDREVSCTCMKT
jgi:hypothetical protein